MNVNGNHYDLHKNGKGARKWMNNRNVLLKWSKWSMIALIAMMMFILGGCGASDVNMVEGKVNVVTSFYPLYDFTRKIGGEHVNVINLIPAGVESHDWTPKSRDMKNITKADILVYNGAGFEGWVHDFLESLKGDSKLLVIEASQGIPLISTSEEGEPADEAHEGEEQHDGHSDEQGHSPGGVDPHVWLSPLQMKKLAENIKDALVQADAAHQSDYEANFELLAAKLDELHQKYVSVTSSAARKDIVVSHQAFGYLVRDYGLRQLPVMGLSPESEPTAQDIRKISQFVREHNVRYILFEELVSPKLAQTLADDLNIETLVFNPIEGLTEEQEKANEDYISLMEKNLISLEKALQQ
jgi:zinc transport system substrate-binding protein